MFDVFTVTIFCDELHFSVIEIYRRFGITTLVIFRVCGN